ncbi:cell division protein ZapA [Fibrella aestuarina BUZ 2]|uniref:Cell division protein ZapA n=1 Tax=Fibrella aestuarina BUZ 2 TaxID=1166018 RepID=I0K5I2_9BACT|nr:cell division protein ZapA [Fibrella aestuarina]CCG99385.1 cell division protein ZapA [Fibrella aestuarina BUZ 2]
MEELLSIHLKIADRDYTFKSPPEEETMLREAWRLIRDRVEVHRNRGMRDTQDVMALIAIECLVTSLKSDEQSRQLQNRVYDKVAKLNQLVISTLA